MHLTRTALILGSQRETPPDEAAAAVNETLLEMNVTPLTVEEAVGANPQTAVARAIEQADWIVADVSRPTPNLLYELGYAHALRKPTLVLFSTEATAKLPNDLAGYRMIIYDPHDVPRLRWDVQRFCEYQLLRLAR